MLLALVTWLRKNMISTLSWRLKAAMIEVEYGTKWKSDSIFLGEKVTVVGIKKFSDNPLRKTQAIIYNLIADLGELLFIPVRVLQVTERVLSYAKQGYKSYDWDSGYLISDMEFKLKRMAYEFATHGYAENDEALSQEIQFAANLLAEYSQLDEEQEVSDAKAVEGFIFISNKFKGWWT